jgi:hypothetical protein
MASITGKPESAPQPFQPNTREWLAGMALQGIIASFDKASGTPSAAAEEAVRYADALIAELNKTKGNSRP